MRIAVLSDLHVLGPDESERSRRIAQDLGAARSAGARLWLRGLHRARNRLWNRRAADREASFLRALDAIGPLQPDWIVANGDYSGDSHGIGLSHPPSFESAARVVHLLRRTFPDRCLFVLGDHEIGKYSTELRRGGIRLASLERGERDLGLPSLWVRSEGRLRLVGVNSTLLTLPLFLPEALPGEVPEWIRRRERHRDEIRALFAGFPPDARILLFCHDPSALGELAELPEVRAKLGQVVRTVLGHLHAPPLLALAKGLARLPQWAPRYPVARIIAQGARSARVWDRFRVVVCPSTFGTGHLLRGGFLLLAAEGEEVRVRSLRL